MKIALSVFRDCISTVFDAADQLLIVEMDDHDTSKRTLIGLEARDPAQRAAELKSRGIDALICGAISRPMQASILSQGIDVYSFIRGTVNDILDAYHNESLGQAVFSLPGCHGRASGRRHEKGAPGNRGRGRRCRLGLSRPETQG